MHMLLSIREYFMPLLEWLARINSPSASFMIYQRTHVAIDTVICFEEAKRYPTLYSVTHVQNQLMRIYITYRLVCECTDYIFEMEQQKWKLKYEIELAVIVFPFVLEKVYFLDLQPEHNYNMNIRYTYIRHTIIKCLLRTQYSCPPSDLFSIDLWLGHWVMH